MRFLASYTSPMPAFLIRLLTTASPADDSGLSVLRSAWALFSIIAVLLILFVLVIAGLAVLRSRRRGEQRRSDQPQELADAWSEAGRRVGGSAESRDAER
jgi:cytochrome c biogenesis factor